MSLQIATFATATIAAAVNPGDASVTVTSGQQSRFPTLVDVGTAAPSNEDVNNGVADADYFHAIIRYEKVATGRETRMGWREFVRVWKIESNTLFIDRSVGETNVMDAGTSWDIAEGDTLTITQVLLPRDLSILGGVLKGDFTSGARGSSLTVGTLTAGDVTGVNHVSVKGTRLASDASTIVVDGNRRHREELRLPRHITGGSINDNTLALRGDNTLEGCFVGSMCIVQGGGVEDDYPMVGGGFGDAVSIAQWIQGTLTTSVVLVAQAREYLNQIFGDDRNVGVAPDIEVQRTLTINSVSHNVRHVEYQNPNDNEGGFVVMRAQFPNAVSLSDFTGLLDTLEVDGFRKTGQLVSNKLYADEGTVNNLQSLKADTEFLNITERVTLPKRGPRPTAEDDGEAGVSVGDLWFSTEGQSLHVCLKNDTDAAVWGRIPMVLSGRTVLFEGTAVREGTTYTLNEGATFSAYASLDINGTLFDRSDFADGTDAVVGNKTVSWESDTTFTVALVTQSEFYTYVTEEHVHRVGTVTGTKSGRRDVTDRNLTIRGVG